MESDERFKHLALDPRFKTLRKKEKKVQIDDRFKSMFTDEKFTLKYSKDKRGRNQKKTSGDDLKKYYSLEEEDNQKASKKDSRKSAKSKLKEEEEEEELDRKDDSSSEKEEDEDAEELADCDDENDEDDDDDDDDGLEEDNEEEEQKTSDSELSSSSDESESEEEESEEEEDDDKYIEAKIEYDWKPLDYDAETADSTTNRLAIQNLDWDHLDVKDIYTLVHSIRPPLSVKIYVSEFGKERLKDEQLHGPKEIVEMPKVDEDEEEYNMLKQKMDALNSKEPRTYKVNEYEDADEEMDPKNEEIRERIRRYQLSRMKYYYAVVEFDSVESAEIVYKELDGMEYEGSSLELDLRFIPDDVEFDSDDLKSICDKVPDLSSYSAPQFINSALQQTTVKFTWDETDVKRQEKLHKAYTKNELEKDDLDAYLASETDSEEEEEEDDVDENGKSNFNDSTSVVTANSEKRINKYKMLLASLEEEAEKKKKVDVDVVWGNYSDDEEKYGTIQEDQLQESNDDDDDDDVGDEDDDQSSDEDENRSNYDSDNVVPESRRTSARNNDKKNKKEMKKMGKKKKKKGKRKQKDNEESRSNNNKDDDELDLLVMDVGSKKKLDDFSFNPDDDRFKAVYESGVYNIDPSHPNFKRTEAFDIMAERKRTKRQKTRS